VLRTLRNIFFKDIGWKLFSLIAAVLLWFVATYSEDPIQQGTVTTDVQLISLDTLRQNGLTLLSPSSATQVSVTVSGKRSDISKLDGKMAGLSAYVDFSGIDASYESKILQPIALPIIVNLPAEYTQISKNLKSLSVVIDNLDHRSIEPEVDITGSPKDGYQAQPKSCSPSSIDIDGPASIIATIKSVTLPSVSIATASNDVQAIKTPVVYDVNGKDITDKLILSSYEVTVTVPIYPVETVGVTALIRVNPADGYRVIGNGATYDPPQIQLVGRQSELDKVPTLILNPAVTGDNATENVTKVYSRQDILDILAMNNVDVRLADGSPDEVTVTVPVEQEVAKQVMIPRSGISIVNKGSDSYKVDISQSQVPVTLRGLESDFSGLADADISCAAQLDLSGFAPGTYTNVKLDVTVTNPNTNSVIVSPVPTVTVTITDMSPPATASPAPDSGAVGTAGTP